MKKMNLLPAILIVIGTIIMINNNFSWRVPLESTNFLGGSALSIIGIGMVFFLREKTQISKKEIAVA